LTLTNNGSMKEWKWKINQKAAHVLMEVADTGCFRWGAIRESISHEDPEIKSIRLQYLDSLKERKDLSGRVETCDMVKKLHKPLFSFVIGDLV
jgi:hypothetical protein